MTDSEIIPLELTKCIDEKLGVFSVRSSSKDTSYTVNFSIPHCECFDWNRFRYPCKHFIHIFNNIPQWSFNKLPDNYTESPFLTIDTICTPLKVTPDNTNVTKNVQTITEQTVEVEDTFDVPEVLNKNIDPSTVHSSIISEDNAQKSQTTPTKTKT